MGAQLMMKCRKYQEITLSPVEEEYFRSIKGVEKEVKRQSRMKK